MCLFMAYSRSCSYLCLYAMECCDCWQVMKQILIWRDTGTALKCGWLMGLRKGTSNLSEQAVLEIQSGHVPCTTSGLARARGDGRCDNSTGSSRVQILALCTDCDLQQN